VGLMKLLSGLRSTEGVASPDSRGSYDHMEQNVPVGFEKFPVLKQRKKFEVERRIGCEPVENHDKKGKS
jgi:hypothetical protein